jgi:endonuclease/exonuclease/phosphatase family metal-dependent hydrolase
VSLLKRYAAWMLRLGVLLSAACNAQATMGAAVASPSASQPRPYLRVVTFNTWMVPFREREPLAGRIARAVVKLDADVVALQEVWRERDARALASALNRRGYPWVHWRASKGILSRGSAGLMIASRHPMSRAVFTPFRAGRLPLVLWQPDWFSGKGFLSVDVATPSGVVRVVTTHAQADYTSNAYDLVRLSHMLQLGRAVASTEMPLVVAGDFNVRRGEIGHRALLYAGRLNQLERTYGVDGVYFRGDASRTIREVSSERVLGRDELGRLSDHHGVLAVLELAPEDGSRDRASGGAIERAIADHERRIWYRGAAALLGAAAAVVIVGRLRAGRLTFRRGLLILAAACLGLWCIYYAFVYAPAEARWLAGAAEDLAGV